MRLLAVLLLLTATQVSGLIKDSSAEIVFPQALHFSLDLTIPAKKLVSATLTITPSGQQPIPINLDLKSALQGDDTTSTLSYTWRITVEHPLPLFTSVAYHWSLTATDGTVVTDDGSLIFADPRVDWTQSLYPQEHFNLTAPSSLTPMVDDLRQIHALLQQNTGQPLDVNLLVSSVDPGCTPYQYDINRRVAIGNNGTVVDCDPGIEAAVLAGYQVLILPSDLDPEDFITSALVQQAYVPLWGQKDLPAWFIDGLTQFYEPTAKDALLLPVQEAARGGTLNSLAQMTTISVPADDLWRAQSYGMVLYIADRIGVPGLFDLARVNAADFDTAYQQAMKLPLSALIPAWQQWIFTTGAQGDYGITPYQPPTSTPTVTPTASSTATATVTPSLTPTITPTASNTPPGFRSTYVPPPTVTPSLTFTPPPATVTPRAPGSLPSVTPTPTPLQQTVAQPAFQAGTATFLGLLLVLLIFLFFRLGNRR